MLQFKNVEDLLATAQQIEIGAAERYSEYAAIADSENPEVAALFRRLAEEEKQHEQNVVDLAEKASIDLSTVVPSQQIPSRKIDDISQVKDTQYRILAAAVKREEMAFDVYSQIAANSKDDDMRHYAEILAKEELGHAALLRAMRRRVYLEHKIETEKRSRLFPGPDKLDSIEKFLKNCLLLETGLSRYIDSINESDIDMDSCRQHSKSIIENIMQDINTLSSMNEHEVNELDQLSNPNNLFNVVTFTIDNLIDECDSAYEYYDSFVLNTEDEDIMQKALFLASQTLTQLSLLMAAKR